MLLSISEASKKLGISIGTLREWEKEGLITPARTPGHHRRYDEANLYKVIGQEPKQDVGKKTILYCRCSTEKQRENMLRQKLRLIEHAHEKKYDYEVIEEIASGVNENRRQLNKLMDMIIAGKVCRVVIEWKDRLARFGYVFIKKLCDAFKVEIEIINHRDEQKYEEEITEDIIAIMTSYSARIYGKRGGRSKAVVTQGDGKAPLKAC
jgi:excisionase family DNA binding protein